MTIEELKGAEYYRELESLSDGFVRILRALLAIRREAEQDIRDDVMLRWQQGRCQELAELLDDFEHANEQYMKKRFGRSGNEQQRF